MLDSPLTKAARTIASLTGINDPQSQVLALLNPMVPEAGASVQALEGLGQKAIKAYHGSPHDFERFSVSKIGTGEGAQSYGHGLYFAENEGTARSYRDALAGKDAFTDAKIFASGKPDRAMQAGDFFHSGVNEKTARRALETLEPEASKEQITAWLDAGRKMAAEAKANGRLYEVAIHADPEHLLDWDKPLSEQSSHVQAAVQRMRDAGVLGDEFGAITPTTTGSQLMRNTGVLAPEHNLKRFGVPGIKYLDQGSRAAGEGTRNFVIFDDSLVSVLKKYGVALPVIEGIRQKAQANGGRVAAADVNGAINQ